MKKIVSVFILCILLCSSLTSCIDFEKTFNFDKDYDYTWVRGQMMFEDLSYKSVENHLVTIGNILDRLPDSYKDVEQIREDYIYINSKFELLLSNDIPLNIRHSAARDLLKKDTECENWDIKSAIYDVAHNSTTLWAILLGDWVDEYGNYITIYQYYTEDDEDYGSFFFDTNFYTFTEDDVIYYAFISGKPMGLGYYDYSNTDNYVYTCYITDISYESIKVFSVYYQSYFTLKYWQ